MKDRAIELARQVGAVVEVGLAPVFYDHAQLHRFYQLARNDGHHHQTPKPCAKSLKTPRRIWKWCVWSLSGLRGKGMRCGKVIPYEN